MLDLVSHICKSSNWGQRRNESFRPAWITERKVCLKTERKGQEKYSCDSSPEKAGQVDLHDFRASLIYPEFHTSLSDTVRVSQVKKCTKQKPPIHDLQPPA